MYKLYRIIPRDEVSNPDISPTYTLSMNSYSNMYILSVPKNTLLNDTKKYRNLGLIISSNGTNKTLDTSVANRHIDWLQLVATIKP